MPKSKLSAFLYLLMVFLSGALVGAFSYRLYMVQSVQSSRGATAPARKADPEEIRRTIVADMRDKIKLDNAQVEQLNKIFDRTREEFDEHHRKWNEEGAKIRDNQVAAIKAILRPDQIALYDKYRAERDAMRKQHRKGGGPFPDKR